MMSLTVDSCADLECCLHGRRCRFGLKQLNKEMRKCDLEDRNESDDAQSTQKEIPPRQEQALERLARQLRHVEAFAERRQKRREKREKRRAERRKKRESQRSTETESNRIVDSSSSKQFMSGDACCKMDEVVNVSVPSTPKTKNVLKQSGEEDLPVKVTSKATDEKGDETDEKMTALPDNANVDSTPQQRSAKSYYIGICNFSKAENNVEKRTDFKLYHGMMRNALIDDLDPELELTLVYKTANGSYRHYPIRTGSVADSKYYYVDCGEKRPFHHSSLNHLVKYHQINAQRHPEQHEYADLFPWWEMSY